jgi:hypothetical protein
MPPSSSYVGRAFFFLSMDRKTLNYDHMAVEVPNGDIMVSEFLMSFM